MKILIADDDVVSSFMLQRTLESWGYAVTVASNGVDALQALQEPDAPNLMILDWMMPGLDGPEIIRRLRQQNNDRYDYVILLTARDQQGDIVEGLEAGADDYLRKPFDQDELRARLRAGQRILDLQARLVEAKEELRIQATQDLLTQLPNRRSILKRLSEDAARCHREQLSLGVLMVDLDFFKKINDTFGHAAGDEVLRTASDRMRAQLRKYDTIGRFGGEEFLVVLPNITHAGLLAVAERIRVSFSEHPILAAEHCIHCTSSIGASLHLPGDDLDTQSLIHKADMALYRSKASGRNRVSADWLQTEAA